MEQSNIITRIEEVFGPDKGQAWLHQPNITLNGQTPAEYIQTSAGIKEIEKILLAIENGGVC